MSTSQVDDQKSSPISLFSKMGDKGEGGFKNLKKWVTSFMDGPQVLIFDPSTLLISGGKTATQNHFRDRLTFANFE